MNKTDKKKVNFIASSPKEESSPSFIALSFDGNGSLSWNSICWVFFPAFVFTVYTFCPGFPTFLICVPLKRLD
jgi:hypothetical protein